MPYATTADMLQRFSEHEMVQLTDFELPPTGAVVNSVLNRALATASDEIDGFLVGRYTLPLDNPPALLNVYCCDIARYRLMTTSADERAKNAYDQAVAYLRDVAAGKINLMPPAAAPAPQGVGTVLFSPGSKVMGRTESGGAW